MKISDISIECNCADCVDDPFGHHAASNSLPFPPIDLQRISEMSDPSGSCAQQVLFRKSKIHFRFANTFLRILFENVNFCRRLGWYWPLRRRTRDFDCHSDSIKRL